MSPKSLLRHPEVVSPIKDFTKGGFKEVIDDDAVDIKKVRKILLCSGKIYYDLLHEQQDGKHNDVAVIRIEQLFPWPEKQLEALRKKYPEKASLVWVQEEPENMGAWTYILRKYRSEIHEGIFRKPSASPATGYNKIHVKEQQEIVSKAFE